MFTLVVLIVLLVAGAHAEQPAAAEAPKFVHKVSRYGQGFEIRRSPRFAESMRYAPKTSRQSNWRDKTSIRYPRRDDHKIGSKLRTRAYAPKIDYGSNLRYGSGRSYGLGR